MAPLFIQVLTPGSSEKTLSALGILLLDFLLWSHGVRRTRPREIGRQWWILLIVCLAQGPGCQVNFGAAVN